MNGKLAACMLAMLLFAGCLGNPLCSVNYQSATWTSAGAFDVLSGATPDAEVQRVVPDLADLPTAIRDSFGPSSLMEPFRAGGDLIARRIAWVPSAPAYNPGDAERFWAAEEMVWVGRTSQSPDGAYAAGQFKQGTEDQEVAHAFSRLQALVGNQVRAQDFIASRSETRTAGVHLRQALPDFEFFVLTGLDISGLSTWMDGIELRQTRIVLPDVGTAIVQASEWVLDVHFSTLVLSATAPREWQLGVDVTDHVYFLVPSAQSRNDLHAALAEALAQINVDRLEGRPDIRDDCLAP